MPQKKVKRTCPDCGNTKEVFAIGGKPTGVRCRRCHAKRTIGRKGHPVWKGAGNPNFGRGDGTHYERGYKLIKLQPDDFFYPMTNNRGFVREHRLVVARALGRCLQFGEVVHHKHGYAKDDNRYPKTLQLNTVDGHNTISAMQNKIDALERKITELLKKRE